MKTSNVMKKKEHLKISTAPFEFFGSVLSYIKKRAVVYW